MNLEEITYNSFLSYEFLDEEMNIDEKISNYADLIPSAKYNPNEGGFWVIANQRLRIEDYDCTFYKNITEQVIFNIVEGNALDFKEQWWFNEKMDDFLGITSDKYCEDEEY